MLTVSGPLLFQHASFISSGDFESAKRQDQSARASRANMRRRCSSCHPTFAANNQRCPDVSTGSDALKHSHQDRKSTRLNSSHTVISYAVFCLKKKKKNKI